MYIANTYKRQFTECQSGLLIDYLLCLLMAKVDAKSDLESNQKIIYFLPACTNFARMSSAGHQSCTETNRSPPVTRRCNLGEY